MEEPEVKCEVIRDMFWKSLFFVFQIQGGRKDDGRKATNRATESRNYHEALQPHAPLLKSSPKLYPRRKNSLCDETNLSIESRRIAILQTLF